MQHGTLSDRNFTIHVCELFAGGVARGDWSQKQFLIYDKCSMVLCLIEILLSMYAIFLQVELQEGLVAKTLLNIRYFV